MTRSRSIVSAAVLAAIALATFGGSSAGAAAPVQITDLVGDEDNFGYGAGNAVPCAFYNLSDPVTDLGTFDRELTVGDESESWTHDLTDDPAWQPGAHVLEVTIEIPEIFSDFHRSTIDIDGLSLDFTPNGFSTCGPPIVQAFSFAGPDAAFAQDGVIEMTFAENGDDVALDFSRITVVAQLPTSTSLAANPATVDVVPGAAAYLSLSATLTETDGAVPVAGETVAFAIGGAPVCSAITDASGLASCGGPADALAVAASGGTYTATFAGGFPLLGSADDGPLIRVAGTDLP